MRSIWTGAISFGLINIPVKLYTAIEESSLDLDMLDKKDHANIKFKRVNENTGKEVPYTEIVRGYKINDSYVIIEDEDFESADIVRSKTIEVINFVDEQQINSIYYEHPYFLEPDKQAMKAYGLLRDALIKSRKVGLSIFVLNKKERLAVLKPFENVIVLNRIRFEQEIRPISELNLPESSKMKTKEMDLALKLIDQLTENFDIKNYKDTYTAKLMKIIEAKAKGRKRPEPKLKVVQNKQKDLMSLLKKSLEEKKAS